MKKTLLLFAILTAAFAGKGQNLVPNGDFEQYSGCPNDFSQFDSALFWFNPTSATPDYFNQCAGPTMAGIPFNFFGYQFAYNGLGYCGICQWEIPPYTYREYIEVILSSPLMPNVCYHFEMYINSGNYCQYATDAIGVYFSDTLVTDTSTIYTLPFVPQISNAAGNLPDTSNWTLVTGNFTAAGGESYMIIGNFKDNLNTTATLVNNQAPYEFAYVYIDGVSLSPCTVVEDPNQTEATKVFPNPFSNELSVTTPPLRGGWVWLYDLYGRIVLSQKLTTPNTELKTPNLPQGIYTLKITSGGRTEVKRVVKE